MIGVGIGITGLAARGSSILTITIEDIAAVPFTVNPPAGYVFVAGNVTIRVLSATPFGETTDVPGTITSAGVVDEVSDGDFSDAVDAAGAIAPATVQVRVVATAINVTEDTDALLANGAFNIDLRGWDLSASAGSVFPVWDAGRALIARQAGVLNWATLRRAIAVIPGVEYTLTADYYTTGATHNVRFFLGNAYGQSQYSNSVVSASPSTAQFSVTFIPTQSIVYFETNAGINNTSYYVDNISLSGPIYALASIDDIDGPLAVGSGAAADLFVDAVAGNDENDGSSASPFASVAAAMAAATAGDIIDIRAGTYPQLQIDKSGTSGNPIILRRAPEAAPGSVVFRGDDPSHNSGFLGVVGGRAVSHITLDGLTITAAPRHGIFFRAEDAGGTGNIESGITIRNCIVSDTQDAGIYCCGVLMDGVMPKGGPYQLQGVLIEHCEVSDTNKSATLGVNEAITVGGGVDGVVTRNCYVHDTDQYGIDYKAGVLNGLIEYNLIENVEKHGIYLDTGPRRLENITVRYNTIRNAGNTGITIAREGQRMYQPGVTENFPTANPGDQELVNITVEQNYILGGDNGYGLTNYGLLFYKHAWDVDDDGIVENVNIRSNVFEGEFDTEAMRFGVLTMAGPETTVANNLDLSSLIPPTNTMGATITRFSTRQVNVRAPSPGGSVAPIFDAPFPAAVEADQTVSTLIAALDAPTISEAGVPAIGVGNLDTAITVGGDSVSPDYVVQSGDVLRRVVSTTHATGEVATISAAVTATVYDLIYASNLIDGAAASPVPLTIAWPDGVTPASVAEQPARGVLAMAAGVVTYDPDGAFQAQLSSITTTETSEIIGSDGKGYRLSINVFGALAVALEWRTADMPSEGTTLGAGETVNLRLGEDLVPFTVAEGTSVTFPVSPTGERLVRFPLAMGQVISASTAGGVTVGLLGTAPGEISAVRWQGGTPVASDAVDISGSASAFFKAAFATNADAALGRLEGVDEFGAERVDAALFAPANSAATSVVVSDGAVTVTNIQVDWGAGRVEPTVEIGKTYRISGAFDPVVGFTPQIRIQHINADNSVGNVLSSSIASVPLTFTATTSRVRISLVLNSSQLGRTATFRNISLREYIKNFDLSLDLSAVSGNVAAFTIGGTMNRAPETSIPIKGVGMGTFAARIEPDGALTLAISTTNPATVILADRLDADDLPGLLADAPAASTAPVIDAGALATALAGATVGAETTLDLTTVTSGGVAPLTFETDTGSLT